MVALHVWMAAVMYCECARVTLAGPPRRPHPPTLLAGVLETAEVGSEQDGGISEADGGSDGDRRGRPATGTKVLLGARGLLTGNPAFTRQRKGSGSDWVHVGLGYSCSSMYVLGLLVYVVSD